MCTFKTVHLHGRSLKAVLYEFPFVLRRKDLIYCLFIMTVVLPSPQEWEVNNFITRSSVFITLLKEMYILKAGHTHIYGQPLEQPKALQGNLLHIIPLLPNGNGKKIFLVNIHTISAFVTTPSAQENLLH